MKKKVEKKKKNDVETKYLKQKEKIKKLSEENEKLRKILYNPVNESADKVKKRFSDILENIIDNKNINIYMAYPSVSASTYDKDNVEYTCSLTIITDSKTYVSIDKFINDLHDLLDDVRLLP